MFRIFNKKDSKSALPRETRGRQLVVQFVFPEKIADQRVKRSLGYMTSAMLRDFAKRLSVCEGTGKAALKPSDSASVKRLRRHMQVFSRRGACREDVRWV